MAVAGFPGALGTTTTGYRSIGAVQKQVTSVGFPGPFGTTTTGYRTIGAVQKDVVVASTSKFLPRLMLMGCG